MMSVADRFGTHRVLSPEGALPQPAEKIDNTMEIYDNEILIDVETLNIDSASFTQIEDEAGGDEEKIGEKIIEIVSKRGKMHNPVTGSGGMLIGRVAAVGSELKDRDLEVGDRIATLVSLSLTPLKLDRITEIRSEVDQVDVEGKAVLFESGIYAHLPEDMTDTLALAVLDVAGAAAQTARLVDPGDRVLIIGAGGKSGLLCLHEAKKRAGVTGQVLGMGHSDASTERIIETGLADEVLQADATEPLDVYQLVEDKTGGELVDVVINCVNIPSTEMASILACREGGMIYFFSMATSFTGAALGAEGVGKDVEMLIGNGYTRGHDLISLQILRENEKLREIFAGIYG